MARLMQFVAPDGQRGVLSVSSVGDSQVVNGVASTYELATRAIVQGKSLDEVVGELTSSVRFDVDKALSEERILPPLDHPADPAHLFVSGTGLTHLGSAQGRDSMHKGSSEKAQQTDSMRMFQLGVEAGKPPQGLGGAQPEWFYKGDGTSVVRPGAAFTSPAFAQDGGEEPEIAGLYIIGPNGTPYRLGFALGNEFSDHVTEKFNYLWLAHSKLRQCSYGPELVTGRLPAAVTGRSRIWRGNRLVFDQPFLSGEDHMSHSIANLEAHHFKYPAFRRPGDVHIHFFGTATLSFSAGVATQVGDVFEIDADPFLYPLRNAFKVAPPWSTIIESL